MKKANTPNDIPTILPEESFFGPGGARVEEFVEVVVATVEDEVGALEEVVEVFIVGLLGSDTDGDEV